MLLKRILVLGTLTIVTAVGLSGCFSTTNSEGNTQDRAAGGEVSTGFTNSAWVATKNTTRVNSTNPIEAAVLVSRTLWPALTDSSRPGGVVLVEDSSWQNSLAATNLVHHPNNGPILFVTKDGIPDLTLEELKRLNPTGVPANKGIQVIVVGNTSDKVKEQLQALKWKVDLIPADSPAELAYAIDSYYAEAAQELPMSVLIGSSESAEYTIPAGNWIAHMEEPLLYVTQDTVPAETIEALKKRNGKANIYVMGPENIISGKVADELRSYGKVTRIGAETKSPVDFAIAFAQFNDKNTGVGWGLTKPGSNFSIVALNSTMEAIAAAPFSHLGKHAALLWTQSTELPDSVQAYLGSLQPKFRQTPSEGPFNHSWLTGSETQISLLVQDVVDGLLEITSESGGGHGAHGAHSTNGETSEPELKPEDQKGHSGHGH